MVPEVNGDRLVVLGRLDRPRRLVCLARSESRSGGGGCGAPESQTGLHGRDPGAGRSAVFRQSNVPQGVRADCRGSTQGRLAGTLTRLGCAVATPSTRTALRKIL